MMMMLSILILAVGAVAALANICLVVAFLIALRRLKRINAALLLTATHAWTMRGWAMSFDDGQLRVTRRMIAPL